MQEPVPTARRYDLDWVRVIAFALLILYHVGMYYVSWDWHAKSPFASTALEPLMRASSPWRLSLLFFVAGTAMACQCARRTQGFIAGRARRLLIPLLFGMLVLVTPQAYVEVVEKLGYADGYLAFWRRYLAFDHGFCSARGCLMVPTWNHLWFVAYLFIYAALLALALRAAPRALAALSACLGRLGAGWGVLAGPVLLLAMLRLTLAGRFPATHDLVHDAYNHALYFSVFALGYLVAHELPVWQALERLRWVALGAALASYAFITWYFSVPWSDTQPVPEALRALQRAVYALNQWTAIAAVLGFARRRAPGDSAARRYLTEAVFPFYIVHQTAIVVIAHQLKPAGLPPLLEGPLLVAATAAVCLASFEAVRRVRGLRPLFGLGPVRAAAAGAVRPARPASIASP